MNRAKAPWKSLGVPVRKHHRSDINVIFSSRRAVNDHGTDKAIHVLCRPMRVPPSGTIQLGTELVGERFARSDGALSHTRNTVVVRSAGLEEAVPVHRSPLGQVVRDGNNNLVTPVGFNEWSRKLAVDEEHWNSYTIWRECCVRDDPVVDSCLA